MCWVVAGTPGTGTRAAATAPAPGVGYRHVLRGFFGKLSDSTGAVTRNIIVNSAPSGDYSGMVFVYGLNSAGPSKYANFIFNGLDLMLPANTALSCQFSGCGVSETQACTLWGYTIAAP